MSPLVESTTSPKVSPLEGASPFVTLPANRFFWSVIDIARLPARSRSDTQALGYVFENMLPLPLERIHATYATRDGDHIVACGMPLEELRAELAERPGMLTLTPADVPSFIEASPSICSKLNFCTGPFEPRPVRSAKRRLALTACAAWLAVGGAIVWGLERRTAIEHRTTDALLAARTQTMHEALAQSPNGSEHGAAKRGGAGGGAATGAAAGGMAGGQPIELQFVAELRTLRQTRQRQPEFDADRDGGADVLGSLASMAQRWPRDINMLAESLSITSSAMTLRATASSSSDVQRLANALDSIPGWESQQPQVNASSDDKVNATLQWKILPANARQTDATHQRVATEEGSHS